MTKIGPTPGPWRECTTGNFAHLVEAQSGRRLYEGDDGFRPICSVQSCCASTDYRDEEANVAANIRLIAAAPELLAALKALVNLDQRCGWHSKEQDAAIAAIAKAEGTPLPSAPKE